MEKKHISLIALYYQGKDDELLEILESANCPVSAQKDEQKQRFSFDTNEQDRYGNSILNLALKNGNQKLARALWRSGANEMLKDKVGNVPLFLAIRQLYTDLATEMVSAMIPDGVGPELLNRYEKCSNIHDLMWSYSAFSIVVRTDEMKLGKIMLKAGANPLSQNPLDNKTPLYEASRFNRIKFVKAMLPFIPNDADKKLLEDAMYATECMEIRDMIAAKLQKM